MPIFHATDSVEQAGTNIRCLQAGGGAVKSLAAAAGNGLQYAQQVTIFLCVTFLLLCLLHVRTWQVRLST